MNKVSLKKYLTPSAIQHLLHQRGSLTQEQMEQLAQEVAGNTESRKTDLLLLWLPKTSSNFLLELIECLREGESSLGHRELVEVLERGLDLEQWESLSPLPSPRYSCESHGQESTLTILSPEMSDGGSYRCLVSNGGGLTQSQPIHIPPHGTYCTLSLSLSPHFELLFMAKIWGC